VNTIHPEAWSRLRCLLCSKLRSQLKQRLKINLEKRKSLNSSPCGYSIALQPPVQQPLSHAVALSVAVIFSFHQILQLSQIEEIVL